MLPKTICWRPERSASLTGLAAVPLGQILLRRGKFVQTLLGVDLYRKGHRRPKKDPLLGGFRNKQRFRINAHFLPQFSRERNCSSVRYRKGYLHCFNVYFFRQFCKLKCRNTEKLLYGSCKPITDRRMSLLNLVTRD